MSLRCFYCVAFLQLIHTVSLQSVTVEGVTGQTVILPCSFDQKPQAVFWRYTNSRTVCDIIDGKADFTEQDPAYGDRVQIFPSEIGKGNFSIMLSNVKKSDEGPYTCDNTESDPLKVELTVTEQTTTVRQEKVATSVRTALPRGVTIRRQADGVLTILLACALLYSLVF